MLNGKDTRRINVLALERDYEYGGMFDERDERGAALMRILNTRLTRDERRLMILFAECRSNYTKAARQLGITAPTMRRYVNEVRQKMLKFYKNERL